MDGAAVRRVGRGSRGTRPTMEARPAEELVGFVPQRSSTFLDPSMESVLSTVGVCFSVLARTSLTAYRILRASGTSPCSNIYSVITRRGGSIASPLRLQVSHDYVCDGRPIHPIVGRQSIDASWVEAEVVRYIRSGHFVISSPVRCGGNSPCFFVAYAAAGMWYALPSRSMA